MLLNNLSQHEIAASRILPLEQQDKQVGVQMLDNLLEIFVRGETNSFNPNAKFHFLAGVFANISSSPQGCRHFLENSTIDQTPRLSKLTVFTEHSDVIRRGGVVSVLKNISYGCALEQKGFDVLLDKSINLFAYILLPLAGPEDYDADDLEGMLDELQFLEPEKKRESDPQIRLLLLECLVALASNANARAYMREIKVYPIIKTLHIQERSEDCRDEIEKLVNLLMREESS
jgi:hypothetical protein